MSGHLIVCEEHPSDNNRKSEFVEKFMNWSTQDCNNAQRTAIMHKLCLRWWSRTKQSSNGQTWRVVRRHERQCLATNTACKLYWRGRMLLH